MNSAEIQADINSNTVKLESNEHCSSSISENGSTENHSYIRKRTRATAEQHAVLEDTFVINVSPNNKLRKQLSEQLNMNERSIQIWFQNRRAKVKHIQKRTQMQMQQAAIRAQLYHYHQQHHRQSPFGAPPMIQMQPNLSQQPQAQVPPQQLFFYPAPHIRREPLPHEQSVDSVPYYSSSFGVMARPGFPPTDPEPFAPTGMNILPVSNPASWSVPPTGLENGFDSSNQMALSRQSMPPYLNNHLSHSFGGDVSYNDFSHDNSTKQIISEDLDGFVHDQMSPSAYPSENENNGGLNYYTASTKVKLREENPVSKEPPISKRTDTSEQDIWSSSSSNKRIRSPSTANTSTENNSIVTTINPSNIMITSFDDTNFCNFNITALTVGTWHRIKLHSSDLICNYNKDLEVFVWYITEGTCRFKIEGLLSSVAGIEYVPLGLGDKTLAEVHIYMTQPPLFYMESASNEKEIKWIQCSDFTENKQASRYMRHVLKGAGEALKQDLMTLISQQEGIRSLVKFNKVTETSLLLSQQQQQQQMSMPSTSESCHPSSFYSWSSTNDIPPNFIPEQFVTCGFYS